MSRLATAPPTVEAEEPPFDAAMYALPVPTTEGRNAQKIGVQFSGSCDLDRMSADGLVFLEAMRLGVPVRLVITGLRLGKRVDAVEIGELA